MFCGRGTEMEYWYVPCGRVFWGRGGGGLPGVPRNIYFVYMTAVWYKECGGDRNDGGKNNTTSIYIE